VIFIGAIYPSDDGLHVVSKYFTGSALSSASPPGILIRLSKTDLK
jgi:hypothetical protein